MYLVLCVCGLNIVEYLNYLICLIILVKFKNKFNDVIDCLIN